MEAEKKKREEQEEKRKAREKTEKEWEHKREGKSKFVSPFVYCNFIESDIQDSDSDEDEPPKRKFEEYPEFPSLTAAEKEEIKVVYFLFLFYHIHSRDLFYVRSQAQFCFDQQIL